MGKPKCTQENINRAIVLKKGGALDKDIAAAIGVNVATFSRWKNEPANAEQRQLSDGLKKAEADYKNALLAIILKEAKEKDWKAAAWLLERKYPSEYSRYNAFKQSEDGAKPVIVLGVEPKVIE